MTHIANPKLFRELSEPFTSNEEADKALRAFFDELGELRKKHRIRDLHMIVGGSVRTSDDDEGEFMSVMHYGDSSRAEAMSAYAYGVATAERQEVMSKFLKGTRKRLEDR